MQKETETRKESVLVVRDSREFVVRTDLSKGHRELRSILGSKEGLDVVVVGLAGERALELDEPGQGEGGSFESSVDLVWERKRKGRDQRRERGEPKERAKKGRTMSKFSLNQVQRTLLDLTFAERPERKYMKS